MLCYQPNLIAQHSLPASTEEPMRATAEENHACINPSASQHLKAFGVFSIPVCYSCFLLLFSIAFVCVRVCEREKNKKDDMWVYSSFRLQEMDQHQPLNVSELQHWCSCSLCKSRKESPCCHGNYELVNLCQVPELLYQNSVSSTDTSTLLPQRKFQYLHPPTSSSLSLYLF